MARERRISPATMVGRHRSTSLLWWSLLIPTLTTQPCLSRQDAAQTGVELAGQVDLVRLVDLSAKRLGLNIEYDPNLLKSAVVTLRLTDDVSDHELWDLTNQLLAARGFTSVIPVGNGDGNILSIVKLSDAAAIARVERVPLETKAGFASVLVPIEHRSLKAVSDAVKLILSKPGGAVVEVPTDNLLLISDLRSRLDDALALIEELDRQGDDTVVETIPTQFLNASQLAAMLTAAVTNRNAIAPKPLEGKLTAVSDGSEVVLVAPRTELLEWRALIEQFDNRAEVTTRSYAPLTFSLDEVATLIEQTAKDSGPRGAGERWNVVQDKLTGLLIVTATPAEHERIAALIERLNAAPAEIRRPMRVYPIRNRSVQEVVDVLTRLLEAGVLEADAAPEPGPASIDREQLQRTPPSVTPPVAPEQAQSGGTLPSPQASPADALRVDETVKQELQPRAAPTFVRGSPIESKSDRPAITLTADEGTNTLIAVGEPRMLDQLEDLLKAIDVRQPQVMVEALIVNLSESDTLDLGVELEKMEVSGGTMITLASLFGLGGGDGGADVTGRGFTGLILNPGDFRVLIRALETLNEGRTLNIPRVLVNNNQQANIDAVVQQPFVSVNASDTVATTSFGGFENAGTTVTVRPQIAKGDHLVLEYSVSLSAFVGESSDASIPPPRQQNTLQSIVTVPDGFTIAVGGIEAITEANAVSQVPLLGDIPWIGEVFKNRSLSKTRSRFFVFIRPSVLRHPDFEDLKYASERTAAQHDIDDGWPEVKPQVMR